MPFCTLLSRVSSQSHYSPRASPTPHDDRPSVRPHGLSLHSTLPRALEFEQKQSLLVSSRCELDLEGTPDRREVSGPVGVPERVLSKVVERRLEEAVHKLGVLSKKGSKNVLHQIVLFRVPLGQMPLP